MPLPPVGSSIALSQVNNEDGFASNSLISLNDTPVRLLAGVLTGTIGMSDLLGKSNDGLTAAYYFDGQNDGIKINNDIYNSANLTFGTGDFTVEFWMKANTNQDTYSMIMDSSTNNTGLGIGVGQNIGGTPGKLSFYAQGGASSVLNSSNNVTDNTWRHIACVKYANTGMLFVNGVKEANTASGAWSTVTNAYLANGQIGRSNYGSGSSSDNRFTGWLSNIRIVKNRALYTNNFTVPNRTLSPVANTVLLTLKSGYVVDESANAISLSGKTTLPELTLTEVPSITPTVPVTFSTSSTGTANVYTLARSAGFDGNNGLVVVTINSGVILNAPTTGSFAMVVDDLFPGGVKIVNNGTILGKGGDAGGGGSSTYTVANAGGAGGAAGPALSVLGPVKISNLSGRIAGGGGGGGGGGGSFKPGFGTAKRSVGGGGGGGGIGVSSGAAGGTGTSGNGGTGGNGTTTSAGGGGAAGQNGILAGGGGAGGSYGASGGNGGKGSSTGTTNGNGGTGGAAGTAISGFSKITWLAQGTINGATSG